MAAARCIATATHLFPPFPTPCQGRAPALPESTQVQEKSKSQQNTFSLVPCSPGHADCKNPCSPTNGRLAAVALFAECYMTLSTQCALAASGPAAPCPGIPTQPFPWVSSHPMGHSSSLPHHLTFFQACKLIFAPLRGLTSVKFSFQVLFTGFPQKFFCFGRFMQTSTDEKVQGQAPFDAPVARSPSPSLTSLKKTPTSTWVLTGECGLWC